MLTAHLEREQLVGALKKHVEQANAAAVQDAWALVEKSKRQDDADVRKLLSELVTAHREQIKFVSAETRPDLPGDDSFQSLSVTPSLKSVVVNRERPEPSKDQVLALRAVSCMRSTRTTATCAGCGASASTRIFCRRAFPPTPSRRSCC